MKTLVIGGAGFIGRRIVNTLAGNGHQVTCFDIRDTQAFGSWGKQVQTVRGDLTSFEDVIATMAKTRPQVVINLSYSMGSHFDPRPAMQLNVLGMDNCFEAARLCDVEHVLFSSSIAVNGGQRFYGDRDVRETDPTVAEKQYAVHKVFNEWQAREYREKHGMTITALRIGNVSGADKMFGSVDHVQCIVKPALGESAQFKFKDRMRSVIYADDVADMISRIAQTKKPLHAVYNSGGTPLSLGQLADMVREFIPAAQINFEHETGGENEPGASAYRFNNDRLTQEFGIRLPRYEERVEQIIRLARATAASGQG